MGRIIRSVFILVLVAVLTSCEYWNKDMLGYLEYWGNTVQMGRLEVNLGGSSQKNNAGVDTIPVSSTPIITGYIINPQGYPLVDDIGGASSPNVAVRVSDSDVQSKTSMIAQNLTMLQVQVATADSTLEHRTVTVNMEAIRSDTMVSAGVVMGVTFQYNTPPAAPMPVVKNGSKYELVRSGTKWEASEGKLYWAYYNETEEKEPNCAKSFKVGSSLKSLDECQVPNETISGYNVFSAQTGSASTSVAAVDSEGVTGAPIVSGQVAPSRPSRITYANPTNDGLDGRIEGTLPSPQSFEKGTPVTLANKGDLRRAGCTFVGWSENPDGSGQLYETNKSYTFNGDITLYSKWEPVTEFYVSSSGSDEASNDGSENYPFGTIDKALHFIKKFNDGTKNFTINVVGTYNATQADVTNGSVVNIEPDKTLNLTIQGQNLGTINANKLGRVMYIGADANVTLKNISLTGGFLTRANGSGGGAYITDGGSLTLGDGATISDNTATIGGGVYNNGKFTMSGSATVNVNNDVYLPNGKTITVGDTLTGNIPVATIKPERYSIGTPVLNGSNVAIYYDKFALTPLGGSVTWEIDDDGTLIKGN